MPRTDNFQKFVKKPKSGAVKEKFKQEKKKDKKERSEAIENHYAKKREERMLMNQQPSARPAKPSTTNKYAKGKPVADSQNEKSESRAKPSNTNKYGKGKPVADSPKEKSGPYTKPERFNKFDKSKLEPTGNTDNFKGKAKPERFQKSNETNTEKASSKKSSYASYRDNQVDPNNKFSKPKPPRENAVASLDKEYGTGDAKKFKKEKPGKPSFDDKNKSGKKPHVNRKDKGKPARAFSDNHKEDAGKFPAKNKFSKEKSQATPSEGKSAAKHPSGSTFEIMPLNKYIAHSGVCARRDAAIIVKDGKVKVNGDVITDPGTKVSTNDVIEVGGKKITPSKNFVYILLNKPKDYITTSDDPQGRRTVLDLVRHATTERIYPVGRLDRNTSGVLLLTNDGDLSQKLSHPSHEVKKVYEVRLDRALTKSDMEKIAAGVTLEDGLVSPDAIAYADAHDKSIIGIEIHSGRNRIVRRIFEHMKYDVKGLDRVMFAGLTKKDVQRGKWRFLKEKELRILKFMNQSFVKSKSDF